MLHRRDFLRTAAAGLTASALPAQTSSQWSGPVRDIHFHMRPTPEANVAHLDGCGVTHAVLLTNGNALPQVRVLQDKLPGRFTWMNRVDITKPEAEAQLRQAVKDGAVGLGEIKFQVAADGPEMRRMYALAADLDVPILIHFAEVPQSETDGRWSTGYKRFDAMLKAYPKTRFIGHGDAFWANVSTDYKDDVPYPPAPSNAAA
jgi:hypothetical protein